MNVDLKWKPLIEIEQEKSQTKLDAWERDRRKAYQKLSDPVFMQYQRGEATKEQWLKAVDKVKELTPKPEDLHP